MLVLVACAKDTSPSRSGELLPTEARAPRRKEELVVARKPPFPVVVPTSSAGTLDRVAKRGAVMSAVVLPLPRRAGTETEVGVG